MHSRADSRRISVSRDSCNRKTDDCCRRIMNKILFARSRPAYSSIWRRIASPVIHSYLNVNREIHIYLARVETERKMCARTHAVYTYMHGRIKYHFHGTLVGRLQLHRYTVFIRRYRLRSVIGAPLLVSLYVFSRNLHEICRSSAKTSVRLNKVDENCDPSALTRASVRCSN